MSNGKNAVVNEKIIDFVLLAFVTIFGCHYMPCAINEGSGFNLCVQ